MYMYLQVDQRATRISFFCFYTKMWQHHSMYVCAGLQVQVPLGVRYDCGGHMHITVIRAAAGLWDPRMPLASHFAAT